MSSVLRIAVGSANPAKMRASQMGAEKALKPYYESLEKALPQMEFSGFNVKSGVSDQPMSSEETRRGAETRARNAYEAYFNANGSYPDFSIGLEGGVELQNLVGSSDGRGDLECFAWIAVYNGKKVGTGRTGSFSLPHLIRNMIIDEGLELGVADDRAFGTVNSKHSGGSVGQFTRGVINRDTYYESAVVFAFVPFLWSELYDQ